MPVFNSSIEFSKLFYRIGKLEQTSDGILINLENLNTGLSIDGDGLVNIDGGLSVANLTVLDSLTVEAPTAGFDGCEIQTLGVIGDSNLNNLYVVGDITLGDDPTSLTAITGTLRVNGSLTSSNDLQVNGGDLTSTSATFNLLNSGVSTINIGGASSAVNIGNTSGTGYTTIKGNFAVTGNVFLGNTQEDVVTFNAGNISLNNNLNFDSNTLYIDRTNNRIGIGTNSPSYPLHVYGSVAYGSSATYGFLSSAGIDAGASGIVNTANDSTAPFGIKAEQRIAAVEFNAISDMRNKHIYQTPEENLIERFKKISVIDFKHKEYSSFELDRGVIAQEVEEIFPDSVKKTKDYVSDIFGPPKEKINISEKEYKLILNEKHSAKIGDKIKIAFKDNEIKQAICEIILIEDEHSITIKSEEKISDNCSIMGRLVDDYRLVNYQYLFSTTIKVVQSLLHRIEILENKLSSGV